ncbi:MAG: PAS domain S-box protein, partial [Chloroflexota bacterium]
MIDHTLRVLILEDNQDDALFAERELEKTGFLFESTRVEKLADFRTEVSKLPDLVLADYSLPSFTALDALAVMKELQLSLPFVLISGKITEKTAVRCIKAGASDYVNKDHLETLAGAVHQALAEHAFYEEKLQMERALAEREAKYRMLFEDSSEGIVVTDLDGKIVDCNLAFERLLGYQRDEIFGEQIFKFFQDEEKRGMINQLLDEQGMVKNFELAFYTKEADQIYGLITISYLNDDSGKPELLLGLLRDISDRIKSKKEMETIVAINSAMRTALDNESLIPIALDLVMEISGAQGVALELVRQTSGKMELTATIGTLDSLSPGDLNLGEDELAQLLKRGSPKIWQIGEEREFLEKTASTGLQMMVCVPLVSSEIDIGLIWMGCDNDLSLENMDLIQILANITASTIHRFNLNENNLRALEESRAVARIGRTLNEHLDLEKVFALIVEEAVGLVSGAYRAVIHVFDEKNERLHAVGFSEKKNDQIIAKNLLNIRVNPRNEFDFGLLSEADIEAASMVSGRGVAGLVIEEGQTINVANTEEDSRYLKTNGMSTASSLVVAPIISLDRP